MKTIHEKLLQRISELENSLEELEAAKAAAKTDLKSRSYQGGFFCEDWDYKARLKLYRALDREAYGVRKRLDMFLCGNFGHKE